MKSLFFNLAFVTICYTVYSQEIKKDTIKNVDFQFVESESKLIINKSNKAATTNELSSQALENKNLESTYNNYPKDIVNNISVQNAKLEDADQRSKSLENVEPSAVNTIGNFTNITLDGKWSVELDLKTKDVFIKGSGNKISNKNPQKTNDLKIALYYTKDFYDGKSDLKGFEIFNSPLDPIAAKSYINEPKIKSNYFNKVPKGDYYLVLVLTEKDATDGIFKVKSFRTFENLFKFD